MKKIMAILIVLIGILIGLMLTNEKEVLVLETNSYVLTNNYITDTLFKENYIQGAPVYSDTVDELVSLYQNGDNYYFREDNLIFLNKSFPIYTSENQSLINIDDKAQLIDDEFYIYDNYFGTTLIDGGLYNPDKDRADNNNYLFLKTSDNLLINSIPIIVTTANNTYTINSNSILNFTDTGIKYYGVNENVFLYSNISDVDGKTLVEFSDKTITYNELLSNLGKKTIVDKIEEIIEIIEDEIIEIVEPEEIPEEETKIEDVEEEPKEIKKIYIEPKVTIADFEANVYSITSNIAIYDPSKVITDPITVLIKKGDKVVLRKTFYSSGNIEIGGLTPGETYDITCEYSYLNENDVKLTKQIKKQTIKMGNISDLAKINLSYENGLIYSSKVELNNIKITSEINSQLTQGVKKVILTIDGDEYKLSQAQISTLLSGNSITYISPDKIKSNKQITYEFKFYDSFGNEFALENNSGTTRTCKKEPKVKIKTESIDVVSSNFKVELTNEDNISIKNFRYIIYNQNLEIVSSGDIIDNKISVSKLDSSGTYTLKVYGDYDIEDGTGIKENSELGNTKFVVPSLSSLGYVRTNLTALDITDDTVKLSVALDLEKVDYRLVFLMSKLDISLLENDNSIYNYTIENDELETLKNGDAIELTIDNLTSSTTYDIACKSLVSLGSKDTIVNTIFDLKNVTTLKRLPKILVKNKFSTETMIDFDLKIEDLDNSILDNTVYMQVRDSENKLIADEKLTTNDDYIRFTYNKLESFKDYNFIFTTLQYNIGSTNATYVDNYELGRLTYQTSIGISGSLELNQLITVPLGKNLYDFEKNTKLLTSTANYSIYTSNEKIRFVMSEKSVNLINFAPDVDVEPNTTYVFSFDIEMQKNKTYGTTGLYAYDLSKGGTSISVTNISTSDKRIYKFTTGATTTRVKLSMYIGGINTTSGTNALEVGDTVIYSNIQLEKGDNATTYESFESTGKYQATISTALNDSNEEIRNNRYYVDVYKNGVYQDELEYSLDGLHNIEGVLHNIDVERDSEYELKLLFKIEERMYEVATLTFTTEQEIRSINSIDDFYNMTPNGKYIVTTDLDFTKVNKKYGTTFTGEIDFQGHTLKRNVNGASQYLFYHVATAGVIKNIVLDITLDNTVEKSDWWGLVYEHYGTIDNVMVTLNSSTNYPNVANSLLVWRNRGVIDTFVINTKEPMYGLRYIALVATENRGTIRNGYLYGAGIDVSYNNETAYKDVGVVASVTLDNSLIENVFSLVDIKTYSQGDYNKQIGTFVGRSDRTLVKNSYSVTNGKITNNSGDVSIGIITNNYISDNVYYVSDTIYSGKYSKKVSPLALNDVVFQESVLNSYSKFKVEENVSNGYYPHVIFNECMPRQELIELPEATDTDLVDIISSELVETSSDETTINLTVNNPSAEEINDISIKYLTTEIVSQEDSEGKSIVTLKITNPQKYLSSYSVMSISSKSAYGSVYTRNYTENERNIYIDLYREIKTLNDWRSMNTYNDENFELKNDLDFSGAANIIITKTYSGKLDGNNYTIRNITIEENNGLIASLTGTIENLYVENFTKTSSTDYGGLVGQATGSPKIKNVHMTNVEVNGRYSGGIVGYTTYLIISDSSVTNFKTKISSTLYNVNVGGLVGYVNNVAYIQNCYAQDLDIEITNTIQTSSIGGIVGRISGGVVENVYTIGSIKANATLGVGGIVGQSNGTIRRAYSKVNIDNKFEYVGGIIGYDNNANNAPSYTLSLGNLYSNTVNNYLRRTTGNRIASATLNNYAYEEQLINGYPTEIAYGETLLTLEQLQVSSTYSVLVDLGESFDYSEIDTKQYLPKLYGSDGNLLPNQKDNRISSEQNKVEILDINQGINDGSVYLSIENPENYSVESIEFDYLKIKNVNLNQNQDGKTYINVTVEPNRYYDTYKLEKINFNIDGEIKTITKTARIELKYYKNLETFDDWQKIEDTNENYRLVADIDFSNQVNINKNISFGRLEGTDDGHTLKNLNLTFTGNSQSLIRSIGVNLENVNFENITLTNSSSGSYFGLILFNSATVNNVNFKDITIKSRSMNYVGAISYNMGRKLTNITLDNMNVTGNNYTGSFIGYTVSQNIMSSDNIKLNKITVVGSWNVGGAIGYSAPVWTDAKNTNYNVYDVSITGTGSYVGGVFGYGSMYNGNVEKVTVSGVSNVGGVSGYFIDYMRYVTAKDIHVKGSGNTIGGIVGYGHHIYDTYLYDSDVTGTTTSSNNVGGIVGNSGWNFVVQASGTRNVTVKSLGSNVGGIKGYQNSSIYGCFVYNGYVEGKSNVGGTTGYFLQGTIQNTSINATVKATTSNAGGLIGYVHNQYTNNANYISRAAYNMVLNTTVTAPTNVGGLIGATDVSLYSGHYFSDLVVANLYTTNQSGNRAISVGSDATNASRINNFRTYNKSKINDLPIENVSGNGLTSANLLTLTNLKTSSTYTNMGLPSGNLDLTQLAKGYFPLIKYSSLSLTNQVPIPLPTETTGMNALRITKSSSLMRTVHELPKIYVYQTDIDKVNIEASSIDSSTEMKIYQNGSLIDTKVLTERVYTYSYDYNSEITIELTDGLSTSTKTYTKDDLNNEASVINNNYFYIKQNQLISNKYQTKGNFVNLYKNYALDSNGVIYNLEENKTVGKIDKTMKQLDTIPLYTFDYEDYKIKTYKTFSESNNSIIEYQLIVKNGILYTLDKSLPIIKNSIILDNYGGNSYESILCEDSYIYDLNTKLKVPSNFKNTRIKYMTNNINDNSSTVVVMYEDGTVYGFDYRTGTEIFNDKNNVNISIFQYFYNYFVKPENIMSVDLTSEYNDALDLEKLLILNPIEKIISGNINYESNETTKLNNYTIVYDYVKNDYVIYNNEELLSSNKESNSYNNYSNNSNIESQVESKTIKNENNKIEENIKLYNYYKGTLKGNKKISLDGLIVFLFILGLIILNLIFYLKNYKFFTKTAE